MLKTGEIKHTIQVRIRAFRIWQALGYNPWKRPKTAKKEGGDFYKGAFSSIPFLNDDAKRTFVHLLLRPGYMIRDYINGKHDRYLAPLTALIIFYAFFSLISAVLQPLEPKEEESEQSSVEIVESQDDKADDSTASIDTAEAAETSEATEETEPEKEENSEVYKGIMQIAKQGYTLLHLDTHTQAVDTRPKAALAALESSLRSKGITLFLGDFFLLWFSMGLCLRKYRVSWSASAAAAAYVLCQFCFFMFFTVLLTWGKSTSAGIIVQALILVFDYHQWLSLSWKKSIGRTIKTGILYFLIYGLFWVLVGVSIFAVAWAKGVINLSDFNV